MDSSVSRERRILVSARVPSHFKRILHFQSTSNLGINFFNAVWPYLIQYISDDHNIQINVNWGKIRGLCNVKAQGLWGPIASYANGIRVLALW